MIQIKYLLKNGPTDTMQKIRCIKDVRETCPSLGLLEVKNFVEGNSLTAIPTNEASALQNQGFLGRWPEIQMYRDNGCGHRVRVDPDCWLPERGPKLTFEGELAARNMVVDVPVKLVIECPKCGMPFEKPGADATIEARGLMPCACDGSFTVPSGLWVVCPTCGAKLNLNIKFGSFEG